MAQTVFGGPVVIQDSLTARSINYPSGSIENADVAADADIEATKCQQQFQATFSQEGGANAAAEVRVVHVVRGTTGELVAFHAGSVVKATLTGVCTVDLKKNGTTMLSAPITLDSGNTNYVVEAAALASTALVAGDVLTVVVAGVSGSTLPQGVFARATIREDPN